MDDPLILPDADPPPAAGAKGDRRPRVLVELRETLHGYAGIPQETRLLYGRLAAAEGIELGGLVNAKHDLAYFPAVPPSGATGHGASPGGLAPYQQTRLVAALAEAIDGAKPKHRGRLLGKLLQGSRLARLAAPFRRVPPEPLASFDPRLFSDFIWGRLFAKTLGSDQRPAILATSFSTLAAGHNRAVERAGRPETRLALDSRDWDILLASRPFPLGVSATTRLVVRFQDAIPLLLPHTLSRPSADAAGHHDSAVASIQNGAWFVCSTEPGRADLLRFFPELENRTAIIPVMTSDRFFPDRRSPEALADIVRLRRYVSSETNPASSPGAPIDPQRLQRYVLAVSTIEPRKNYANLLRAWTSIWQAMSPRPLLILVANPGWRCAEELAEIERLVAAGAIIHLAQVGIEELRVLYSHAHLVIAPSVAEGFDLGGVEAMLCGTPVLASDIPTHRWVYGDAARYVDPYDVEAMARNLADLIGADRDAGRLESLADAGARRAALYTPAVLTPRWLALFDRLLATPAPLVR